MADETPTTYDRILALAEELKFSSDSKKEEWINDHMKAAGWKPTTTWSAPEGDEGKKSSGSGWFK